MAPASTLPTSHAEHPCNEHLNLIFSFSDDGTFSNDVPKDLSAKTEKPTDHKGKGKKVDVGKPADYTKTS